MEETVEPECVRPMGIEMSFAAEVSSLRGSSSAGEVTTSDIGRSARRVLSSATATADSGGSIEASAVEEPFAVAPSFAFEVGPYNRSFCFQADDKEEEKRERDEVQPVKHRRNEQEV